MRNKCRSMCGLVFILLLCVSPGLAGDQSDIAGRVAVWTEMYNSANNDALAELYTEDATRMPYQAPEVRGRAAISEMNRSFQEAGAVKIELEVLEAESTGSTAWARGTYHLTAADGSTFQKGKWMNVSKKVGKQWLIHADIWNTDAP